MYKLLQIQESAQGGSMFTSLLLNTSGVEDRFKVIPFIRQIYRNQADETSPDINEVIVRFLENGITRGENSILFGNKKTNIVAVWSDISPL